MKIINKTYEINNTNINRSIVLISDIHYYNKTDIMQLNRVLDKIKKIKPNYICIPGDIVDESNVKDESEFIKWMTKLAHICKVIISIGNHEFYVDKKKDMFELNKRFYRKLEKISNVYLLDNKNIIIDNINFIGITLPIDHYMKNSEDFESFQQNFNNVKTEKELYNILLCHSPKNICNENVLSSKKIDLVLCGHTHGGIVLRVLRPILKNRGFISPLKSLFPKNVYGKLKINNTSIIITSGIRVISHMNRFKVLRNLFASEIAVIKLT